MPSLESHYSGDAVKLLLMGNSGAGKSGALASLANAGYKLRILDYDNGLDSLYHWTKPEARKNVDFVTLVDKFVLAPDGIVRAQGVPTAYTRGIGLVQRWKYTDKKTGEVIDLGSPMEWGPDTVLVVDSLTFQGRAALLYTITVNNHDRPSQPDWGIAQEKQRDLLQILYSDAYNCNIVVTSHIKFLEREGDGQEVGFPTGLGKALPPEIPRFFNHVLQVASRGSGAQTTRKILTRPIGMVDLKSPIPGVPAELNLETGLADYFKLATGKTPQHGTATKTAA